MNVSLLYGYMTHCNNSDLKKIILIIKYFEPQIKVLVKKRMENENYRGLFLSKRLEEINMPSEILSNIFYIMNNAKKENYPETNIKTKRK